MKAPQKPSQDHRPAPPLSDMASIEWSYWQALLSGVEPPRLHPAFVPIGYYRWTDRRPQYKKDVPVAIFVGNGAKWVQIGAEKAFKLRDAAAEEDFGFNKFAYFGKNAITYEAFQQWGVEKAWRADKAHDAIAKSEAPRDSNAPPEVALRETLTELEAECKAWFEGLGEAGIQTQDDADKAANFADRFAEIEKAADTARTEGRKPHLEAAAEVQSLWAPIQDAGKTAKVWARSLNTKWLQAENARRLQEAAAAAAAGQAVRMSDVQGASAGTRGRRQSLRVEQIYVCDDFEKVRAHFLQDKVFLDSREFAEIVNRWAKDYLKAGNAIPGAHLEANGKPV